MDGAPFWIDPSWEGPKEPSPKDPWPENEKPKEPIGFQPPVNPVIPPGGPVMKRTFLAPPDQLVVFKHLRDGVRKRECPSCQRSFDAAVVNVQREPERPDLIRVTCVCTTAGCSYKKVATVELTDELVNEAKARHKPQRRRVEPIDADEVIAVHEFMQGWEGPLSDLIE